MQNSSFIHLHLHSAYSLAEGAIKIKDLVQMCRDRKMPAVAVTDTNNMFGAMEFALEASKNGIQPIMGAQVDCGHEKHQLVLLVQNEAGYRNLCKLLSEAYMNSESDPYIEWDSFTDYNDGLICLSGGTQGPINQYLLHNQDKEAEKFLKKLNTLFKNRFYVELQRHKDPKEDQVENAIIELAYKHNIPLVASNDCYFSEKRAHEAHDALLCISAGRYVTEEDRRKVMPDHYFKSSEEMIELFKDIPEAIENTLIIARRCSWFIEPIKPLLPAFDTKGGRSESEELRSQAKDGLQWRLDNLVFPYKDGDPAEISKPYYERLEYELSVIEQMGFPGYFLICSDFISWAKSQNIPVGPGRGSGAGSLVAWALKITDLDPLEFGLLFERFLNPERVSMPDFDIDFCQERRDEVIRYVQERYGEDRVAQIITFGKLQARAVVRDVGRVLQMPYGMVDRIAKMIPNNPANPMTLEEALAADADLRAERNKDDTHKKLINIALQLEGLYRHASTHAAGVVIGDRPLHELIPLYRDPRSDMPVTQFNMKYVEQAGLVKFDFLGLKTMTVIQKAADLVNNAPGKANNKDGEDDIEILKIPLDDPKTYDLIASGNTVGVFQLESAGMRDALRRIKPNRFEDIIALVSLYRPGPMDNIPTYAKRKDGAEDPDYMHDLLKPYLTETYGIMIYQEQVMQSAQALAGYTLGGADLLRRAMGKKIQAEMDAQREMFMKGAKEHHDVSENKSSEIFDQIAKFAGYGFNKSHAAAYALIAYWTAWLKANHPVEFYAASMTLDLGNTDKLAVFKQDMDRNSFDLLTPDINKSFPSFAVEGQSVRYALAALKGVGAQAMTNIVSERQAGGPYTSLNDFVDRLDPKNMNRRQFEQMVCAGTFDSVHPNRAQLSASAEMILRYCQTKDEERQSGQENLFGGGGNDDTALGMPDLQPVSNWDPLEKLAKEFGAVGFYLSAHPLDGKLEQFKKLKVSTYIDLEEKLLDLSAVRTQMAGVLLKKQEKVSQKGSKYAFLQLSDPTGVYEVTIFSELLNEKRDILEPGQMLLLNIDAESKEEQVRLTGHGLQLLDAALEHRIKTIDIHMNAPAGLKKIKEFLDIEGQGGAKIHLTLQLSEQQSIVVTLPQKWSLSPQARNLIAAEEGVLKIIEG